MLPSYKIVKCDVTLPVNNNPAGWLFQKNNQKLGLCEALLKLGDWDHAKQILERLPPFLAVSHTPLAKALAGMVSYMIEPVYVT